MVWNQHGCDNILVPSSKVKHDERNDVEVYVYYNPISHLLQHYIRMGFQIVIS